MIDLLPPPLAIPVLSDIRIGVIPHTLITHWSAHLEQFVAQDAQLVQHRQVDQLRIFPLRQRF